MSYRSQVDHHLAVVEVWVDECLLGLLLQRWQHLLPLGGRQLRVDQLRRLPTHARALEPSALLLVLAPCKLLVRGEDLASVRASLLCIEEALLGLEKVLHLAHLDYVLCKRLALTAVARVETSLSEPVVNFETVALVLFLFTAVLKFHHHTLLLGRRLLLVRAYGLIQLLFRHLMVRQR